MSQLFKDKEHLVRVAALFAAGFLVFLLAKAILVPKDFGQYGHYRTGALKDSENRPLFYAGRDACEQCHTDVVAVRKGSKHAQIACESCHGPLKKHADDPTALKPERPNGKALCLQCHAENAGKPKGFPQINPKEHGDSGPCTGCHKPHHPEVS